MKLSNKSKRWIQARIYGEAIFAIPLLLFPMTTITFLILPRIESLVSRII